VLEPEVVLDPDASDDELEGELDGDDLESPPDEEEDEPDSLDVDLDFESPYPSRYHPEPLRMNPDALTFLRTASPHTSHGGASAPIFIIFSNSAPQLSHRYS
jgi:hypothetical protein